MNPTGRFGDRAPAYAANRPGYPAAVLDALLFEMPPEIVVADIGAGTGISSEALARNAARVIAIEPNAAMRGQAVQNEKIEWRDGTGEQTGLADKSVDLAVAFQAFHWFDAQAAFEEFTRIARVRIGLVQYERDERDPFSHAYGDLVRSFATDDTEGLRMRTLEAFSALSGARLHRTEIAAEQRFSLDGLLGRIDSASYLPNAGDAADALRLRARDLYAQHEKDGGVVLAMTYHVLTASIA